MTHVTDVWHRKTAWCMFCQDFTMANDWMRTKCTWSWGKGDTETPCSGKNWGIGRDQQAPPDTCPSGSWVGAPGVHRTMLQLRKLDCGVILSWVLFRTATPSRHQPNGPHCTNTPPPPHPHPQMCPWSLTRGSCSLLNIWSVRFCRILIDNNWLSL